MNEEWNEWNMNIDFSAFLFYLILFLGWYLFFSYADFKYRRKTRRIQFKILTVIFWKILKFYFIPHLVSLWLDWAWWFSIKHWPDEQTLTEKPEPNLVQRSISEMAAKHSGLSPRSHKLNKKNRYIQFRRNLNGTQRIEPLWPTFRAKRTSQRSSLL